MISGRRLGATLAMIALAASLTACGADELDPRDTRTVRAGEVLDPSYTAAVQGTPVSVMLPSGRADLTVSEPLDEVAAQDAKGAAPLRPVGDAEVVGVSWVLHRAAYPNSPNRQLAPPRDIFGEPQPVRLTLVADGERHPIPHVGTLARPVQREANVAWVVVPAGVRTWSFEVGYDGVTQTVDVRSGKVDAGIAAPLYEQLPLDRNGSCRTAGVSASCLTDYAYGYPYVRGAGWAPAGRSFLLLGVSISGDRSASTELTVAGGRAVATAGDNVAPFGVYVVQPGAKLPVRGAQNELLTTIDAAGARS